MAHVFISYSREDYEYVRKLEEKLREQGLDVWIDARIDYGEDWWATIVDAIRKCDAFLVVMSPASDNSRWVQREVTLADQLEKPTFPLLLVGDLISSKHWSIFIRTQYSDVRAGNLPTNDFYDRLAQFTSHDAAPSAQRSKEHKLFPANPSVQRTNLTLHEAIVLLLKENENNWMSLQDLLREINSRALYIKRDGTPVELRQMYARTKNYAHLFEKNGNMIRWKS